MSKFSKRILSSSNYCRNALVVGSGLGWLEELINHCNTVFIIDNPNKNIKGRNVIHREDFQDIHILTDVDFLFVDSCHFSNLNKLRPVWVKCRPAIFLEGADLFGVENYKYLRSESYSLVEIFKHMQKWIPQ